MPKDRVLIPKALAAKVLFHHDRRCCVCRQRKPVQIHHIDDDPSNNDPRNLAVLCFDCHRDTQIQGGFDRKLDSHQVVLYRNDWLEHVRRARVTEDAAPSERELEPSLATRVTVARLEIAKENQDWLTVSLLYDGIGDNELRDKYAAVFLEGAHEAWEETLLRTRQGRPDLLSEATVAETLDTDDWTVKARVLADLGRTQEAARTYLRGIEKALDEGNLFTTAYYIKHGLSRLMAPLFEEALAMSEAEGDLWWQLRALEELGRYDERRELILDNEAEVAESGRLLMRLELAKAKGDREAVLDAEKAVAEAGPLAYGIVSEPEAEMPDQTTDGDT